MFTDKSFLYFNFILTTCPTLLNKILQIQNKFLRMISFAKRCDLSATLFRKNKLLPIFNVNTYQTCMFLYKYVHLTQRFPEFYRRFPQTFSHTVQDTQRTFIFGLPLVSVRWNTESHRIFLEISIYITTINIYIIIV